MTRLANIIRFETRSRATPPLAGSRRAVTIAAISRPLSCRWVIDQYTGKPRCVWSADDGDASGAQSWRAAA